MTTVRQSRQAHLLLLAVAALWGATFVLVKDALRDASPLVFNLLRMTIASVCLAVIYRKSLRGTTRASLGAGAMVGACLAAGYQLQTAGLARTTASKSGFITGMVVVLVPLLAATPFLRGVGMPAPRWNAWLGALLGFGGIVLLTSPGSKAGWTSANIGDLLTLGCAFSFALHCMALAHTSRRIETGLLATLQIGFCTLFMAATLPLGGQVYLHMTTRLVIALLVTGVLATAAAFTIQSWAQQYLAPTHTALILAMEPVFAWVTSFLVLGERLSGRAACGAVLVLGGIAVTEFAGPQILANENSL